jgi:hypothetical protein
MTKVKLFIPLIFFLLSGCSSNTSEFYLFGLGNSCFQGSVNKNCLKLKAYDEVKLAVNIDKQSVSFVKRAYGLNDKNIVFNTLENCSIVDADNFSCEGLVRTSGNYINNDVFKARVITQSYILSLNNYFNAEISFSTIRFVNENLFWINLGCLLVIFAFLSAIF